MRFREGDYVRIISKHPFKGHCGTIKWIGEACGFYVELDPPMPLDEGETLTTWVQHVEHIPRTGRGGNHGQGSNQSAVARHPR